MSGYTWQAPLCHPLSRRGRVGVGAVGQDSAGRVWGEVAIPGTLTLALSRGERVSGDSPAGRID